MAADGNTVMTGVVMARVEEFIALRRGLGYRSPSQERALRAFARYLDEEGHEGPIPLESSLNWATATASIDPCNPARRLTMVRGFLRHLAAIDGATEVPDPGLLGSTGHRKPPYIYIRGRDRRPVGRSRQAGPGRRVAAPLLRRLVRADRLHRATDQRGAGTEVR